ncbi:virB8 family protein [Orientia chuto str. Dubai]|uniref:VirB8 family protein n=1 Tax=Orientia chuto str. Dubai TaxID=1359168 RepID=A0A0F3MLP5_9RICK|nr:VirB8/TrbF family protein [Candidatus Orientia mediorientalis]KJV56645.1 virB8 family protein [Orientia chuto str. Dubai]
MDNSKITANIKSGKYFQDAYTWYKSKYLYPLLHRSIIFIVLMLLLVLIALSIINVYSLLPITKSLKYIISVDEKFNAAAKVTHADQVLKNPLQSIIKILAEGYVIKRESYNYNELASQFQYIKNRSTRGIFRQFVNYMSLENYHSPVLRYQKTAKRKIKILSSVFLNNEELAVYFHSCTIDDKGNIFEDMEWKANINFETDQVNLNAASGSIFKFFVTDYKITLLRNNNGKHQQAH